MLQHEIKIDLRNGLSLADLSRPGGQTLVRLVIVDEQGRQGVAFLSARISGDQRAGATNGVHIELEVVNRTKNTQASRHLVPWKPVDENALERVAGV